MNITGDNISDDQIRELGVDSVSRGDYLTAMWCDYALITEPTRCDIPAGCDRTSARAHCAKLLMDRAKDGAS